MFNHFRKQLIHICKSKLYCTAVCSESYKPSRALLYVPGSDKKKLEKSLKLKVDCLVLNCEDGVANNMKEVARNNIVNILNDRPTTTNNFNLSVRVNELNSEFFKDDMRAFLSTNTLPDTILLPKIHQASDMTQIAIAFHKCNVKKVPINVILYIESARSVMNMKDICKEAFNQSRGTMLPVGVIFGGDDYLASIGAAKTKNHMEILYARQKVVNVAKAFDLQCIDIVHINYKDLQELEEQCIEGAKMGYTGKQVIHPIQVEIVQKCFSPTSEQIEWATALMKEYNNHQNHGFGAFTFQGNMIDAPLMKQARNIIKLSERS